MLVIFAIVTVWSNNRMALVASASCLATIYICRGNVGIRTIVVLLVASVTGLAAYTLGDVLLVGLARSGSAEEILSLTGRTVIWNVTLELWSEHPFLGLGFGSSVPILGENLPLWAVGNTHNMYLEVLVSSGLIGLCLMVASLAMTIKRAVGRRRYTELGLVAFFAVYGLTEAVIFSVAGLPTLLFFASLILTFMPDRSNTSPNIQSR
jgi:O-antigen ligase